MKFYSGNVGLARSLMALLVSLALVISAQVLPFASSGELKAQTHTDLLQVDLTLSSATAVATNAGVLLQWRSSFEIDNVGFNIYRLKDGRRTRVNREIIPGSVFIVGEGHPLRGGYSYSWFDSGGTANSIYYIESVNLQGISKLYNALTPEPRKKPAPGPAGEAESATTASASSTEVAGSFEKFYPAFEDQLVVSNGPIEDQWTIAAQPGLKISIKRDGWYRVTQPQMVAAGFNPSVDISKLRLFEGAQEVAINTSQSIGLFAGSDFIEFYGRGLDTPTTDTRTYYLIAGTTAGKRVRGELSVDSSPPAPPPITPTSALPALPARPSGFVWVWRFLNTVEEQPKSTEPSNRNAPEDASVNSAASSPERNSRSENSQSENSTATANHSPEEKPLSPSAPTVPVKTRPRAVHESSTSVVNASRDKKSSSLAIAASPSRKKTARKKRKRSKFRRENNHAGSSTAFAPSSFDYTAERKDRTVYFTALLNGDAENFFGQVLSTPANPPNPPCPFNCLTINTPNPELSAAGPALLEIALQGVSTLQHQIGVEFNGLMVGSFSFNGFNPPDGHAVQVISIPVSQLQNGANTVRFISAAGSGLSLVDYVRVTYPHSYRADSDSLKFTLRGTQSLKVSGFSTPAVKLIDYTDPFSVRISKPLAENDASGYAITVPTSSPRSKAERLLYAIPDAQFDQPAALSLNQPSTIHDGNLSATITNGANFLIVAHKNFIPSVAPLVALRQAQGMTAAVVDVEDVYDEFSYGVHGPLAIKDFLSYAATHWMKAPQYVVFLGDASYDSRNYLNVGNFDLVPTKLVDATYNETASDDWFSDFDNDGIGEIPVGRLPVRTASEADLIVSKIINFAPANVPQKALLVADDPTGYFFNFETANDEVEARVPASMTVEKVYRRTQPSDAQARANIIAGFNQGRALVNYSGHGNVDVWTGGGIFMTSDALALNNGNKLSFVVVMDCLNGYFHAPVLEGIAEALMNAPNGGAVAVFASSGLTVPDTQHEMSRRLYELIYGSQPIALGDAVKDAKGHTNDIDVRRTWIFFGDPSMKIR
jgi:peptidase C25-like protein